MKAILAALSASLATAALAGPLRDARDPKPSVYADGLYGFSIQAPAYPPAPAGTSATTVLLMGPAEDGFAQNVNVVVLNADVSLKEYREASLKQFTSANLKVNSETKSKLSGRDAILWDYEGSLNGNELRWLAAAVAGRAKIYLITCTTLKSHFEKHEKGFRACLESFKLTD